MVMVVATTVAAEGDTVLLLTITRLHTAGVGTSTVTTAITKVLLEEIGKVKAARLITADHHLLMEGMAGDLSTEAGTRVMVEVVEGTELPRMAEVDIRSHNSG